MLTLTKVLPALISSGSFTGSFYGTSSYAKKALTASYAMNGGGGGGSGTSGTSGATGTSGTSGNSGSSGTSGNSGTNGTSGNSGSSGTSGGGASLTTGSLYPITSSWSRKSITASYLTTISQSLIPAKNNTYSLGTTTVRWKDLFVSTGSIYIGDVKLSTSGSIVLANSLPVVVVNTSSKQIEVPGLPIQLTSSYALKALTASYVTGVGVGSSGTSGTSGAAGSSGTSGVGSPGTSGTSGTSGATGASGTSGSSGSSGTSGTTGSSGSSGNNGTSGSSGATGASGSSGTSGGGASLTTGSLYPITSSWSRRSLTASYALNASGGGSSLAGAQTFISNGSQTVYTLNQSVVNRDQILVVTNGVVQSRTGSNYTVSGTTLTLSEAVQSGGLVDVRYINAGQGSSGTSGINGTVQTGSIAKQTILYNVTSGSQNVITGLNLSGNKWGVDIKEEWDAKSITGGDQYYPSCSLLMHFNGSNGSTTFIDNSPVTKSFTVNGNSQISTAQSKFGESSAYFDGTGDYLSTNSSNDFAFGTGDFTVEFWIYSSDVSSATQRGFLQTSDTSGGLKTSYTSGIIINQGANNVGSSLNGGISVNIAGTNIGSSTSVITTNTWYHIALVRNSGTSTLYVNGTSVGSGTTTGNCSGTYLSIGGYYNTSYLYQGYLDELRITKGVARYTNNFTPQTSEFPNSQFLTQYVTKYIGLIGGLNDKSVDYGVQKMSDTSLKVVKMTQTTSPFPSGSLSSSVDRVYVNVLDYSKVAVTSSYATNALNSVNSLDIPKIKSIFYTNSSYTPTTASAVDLAKPNTSYITISGSNFKPSASIFIDNTSGSIVTYVNSNKLNVNVISKNIGTYPIYLSNTDGASTFKINAITYIYTGYTIGYLIVAGGGAGGSAGPNDNRGGGGGGGGFVSGSMMVYKTGSFVVTVGSGGSVVSPSGTGTNGNTSSFGPNIIALGGGGGGGAATTGRSGGSGGGGGASLGPGNWSGGAGSQPSQAYGGFGNAGGTGGTNNVNYRSGGGGGGAGGIGGDASISSATGGVGKGSDLTGSLKYYSGGGGSSNGSASPQGGGGNYGVAGSVNTGGGGGGATSAAQGGAGGSGIVIIRYSGPQKGTGGTIKELGGYTIHTFFTSGTFTP